MSKNQTSTAYQLFIDGIAFASLFILMMLVSTITNNFDSMYVIGVFIVKILVSGIYQFIRANDTYGKELFTLRISYDIC